MRRLLRARCSRRLKPRSAQAWSRRQRRRCKRVRWSKLIIDRGCVMTEVILTVTNVVGLHARPAAAFYKKTREFKSRVTIQNLSRPATKEVPVSPFYLLQIGVSQGHQVRLRAE